jgi:hypothetical protein
MKQSNRCDVVFTLKNYIKPLIQLLTNDLPDYNMQLLTTKCLNTAVFLVIMLIGSKAVKMVDFCDTHATIKRHNDKIDDNETILKALEKDLLKKTVKSRLIYYILLTDAHFPHKDSSVYFPGHVIVVEKIPGENNIPYFYLYQSYINEYDLAGHFEKSKGSIKYTYSKMVSFIKDLKTILLSKTWTLDITRKWKQFTFVDTNNLLDSESGNRFFICYKKDKAKSCSQSIKKHVSKKLREIKPLSHRSPNDVYGDSSKYDMNQNPLTNYQMKTSLENLLENLNPHIY